MAKVTMSLTGMEALQRALKTAPDAVAALSSDAVSKTSFAIAQRARTLVPVGATGVLKASIASAPATQTKSGPSGRVGISTPQAFYWRYVEFGTVHQRARPFFRPAAEAESTEYVARIRAIGPQLERDLSVSRFT